MKVRTLVGGSVAIAIVTAVLTFALPEPCSACSPAEDFEELTLELTSVTVDGVATSATAYEGFAARVPKSPRFPGAPVLEATRGSDVVRLIQR